MPFGLFKKKFTSTVNPQLGSALKPESAAPATLPEPPAPGYAPVRRFAVNGTPPQGTIDAQPATARASIEAHVAPTQPPIAVVNTFGEARHVSLWQLATRDARRFERASTASFEPDQARWVMSSAAEVIALPAGQVLIQLSYHTPEPRQGLYVYEPAADRLKSLGRIEPDWSQGVPFTYLSTLQLRPDTLLVMHHTDRERLGAQRYVNHFDHLVLYSPKFPDGLTMATVGLDDGNVRQWGFAGTTLWLRTADERAKPAREFTWSLDLGRVL